ncbi:hypothetical protein SCYAM73S_03508 [Streptomyces cyaneofuscatus]
MHYAADRPERATAKAPAPGKLAAGTGCLLAVFGVLIVFCLGFMVVAHTMFDAAGGFMPWPPHLTGTVEDRRPHGVR